jgi:hypothetical protein
MNTDRLCEEVMQAMRKVGGGTSQQTLLRAACAKAFYEQLNPEMKSDQDLMSVTLRVCDWVTIAQELFDDADAEPEGPATTAMALVIHDEESDAFLAAISEDSDRPAHDNKYATLKAANAIQAALEENGWMV